ncbi:MAG: hypothetical protein J7K15_10410 [Deltaproteobacteria bacterium]|nr:hypothetical protein [Deltaproteobacteria bacterium]
MASKEIDERLKKLIDSLEAVLESLEKEVESTLKALERESGLQPKPLRRRR